jgi:hypothetical protein
MVVSGLTPVVLNAAPAPRGRVINLWAARVPNFRYRPVADQAVAWCEVCGRALRPPRERHISVEVNTSGEVIGGPAELICGLAPAEVAGSQGCFLVGRDCARRIGLIH